MDKKTKEELIKKGVLKPLSDAFKEYPVQEEIHFGHHEWYVAENVVKYGKYHKGDIVFINEYKYQNGSIGRDHLFVIVDDNNTSVPLEYFGFLISSKIFKQNYVENELIKRNKQNNLNRDYIISKDNIIKKIGTVPLTKVEEYKRKHNFLYESYGLK